RAVDLARRVLRRVERYLALRTSALHGRHDWYLAAGMTWTNSDDKDHDMVPSAPGAGKRVVSGPGQWSVVSERGTRADRNEQVTSNQSSASCVRFRSVPSSFRRKGKACEG